MSSAKNKRASKHVDSTKAAKRNLKSEINKAEKKIAKLLKLYESGKKRKNCFKKVRDGEGGETKSVPHVRLQGMKRDGERHQKLLAHVESLKNRLKEIG